MSEAAEPLTQTKPSPGVCYLLRQFMAGDARELGRKAAHRLNGYKPPYVPPAEYAVPDSPICKQALELVTEASPDFLLKHCQRSHAFAVAMAHNTTRPVDREVLYLGCLMHDLGLTEAHDHGATFELDGARAAHGFCCEHGLESARAALVHEMVALHNSVGVAHRLEPEIALVHFGAGADVLGLWVHDVNARTLDEILERFPRKGFGDAMALLIEDQIRRKPDSYMAGMVKLGFLKRLRSTGLPGE